MQPPTPPARSTEFRRSNARTLGLNKDLEMERRQLTPCDTDWQPPPPCTPPASPASPPSAPRRALSAAFAATTALRSAVNANRNPPPPPTPSCPPPASSPAPNSSSSSSCTALSSLFLRKQAQAGACDVPPCKRTRTDNAAGVAFYTTDYEPETGNVRRRPRRGSRRGLVVVGTRVGAHGGVWGVVCVMTGRRAALHVSRVAPKRKRRAGQGRSGVWVR